MANQVDCLVVPEIFVRIKTELLESGEVALELQHPSTPIIKNGIAETKLVLTKQAVDWLYRILFRYIASRGISKSDVVEGLKVAQGLQDRPLEKDFDGKTFNAFAKELDESADKLPETTFAVNPEGVK
jgi:hypothetical protein